MKRFINLVAVLLGMVSTGFIISKTITIVAQGLPMTSSDVTLVGIGGLLLSSILLQIVNS